MNKYNSYNCNCNDDCCDECSEEYNKDCKQNSCDTCCCPGPKGDIGPQGPKGDTGAIGPQGTKGDIGPQGPKGDTGAIGPQGAKGDTGPQGTKGDTGIQGTKGDTGAIGPQGIRGDVGPMGLQGIQGVNGAQGDVGPAGAKGDTGPIGPQGVPGLQGPQGLTGSTGPQGPAGEKGDSGTQGPKGDSGLQGPKGDTGAIGPRGDTGANGPQGPTGATGPQGPTGPKGDSGCCCCQPGPVGATGAQGPAGDSGAQGEKGEPGSSICPCSITFGKIADFLITNEFPFTASINTPFEFTLESTEAFPAIIYNTWAIEFDEEIIIPLCELEAFYLTFTTEQERDTFISLLRTILNKTLNCCHNCGSCDVCSEILFVDQFNSIVDMPPSCNYEYYLDGECNCIDSLCDVVARRIDLCNFANTSGEKLRQIIERKSELNKAVSLISTHKEELLPTDLLKTIEATGLSTVVLSYENEGAFNIAIICLEKVTAIQFQDTI